MAQRLTKLRLNEVSLVDNPASPDALVTLHKRDDGMNFKPCDDCADRAACMKAGACAKRKRMKKGADASIIEKIVDAVKTVLGVEVAKDAETFDDVEARREAYEMLGEHLDQMVSAFRTSIYSIMGDDSTSDKQKLIARSIDEFASALKDEFAEVNKSDDQPPANAGDPPSGDAGKQVGKGADDPTSGEDIMKLEDIVKAYSALSSDDRAKVDAEIAKGKEKKAEEVVKSLSPEDRAIVEKALADAEALKKANAENTAAIAAMRSAQEDATFAKRAEALVSVPGVKTDEFAPILKALHAVDPKMVEKLEQVFKGVAEAITKGALFKSVGADGVERNVGDALAKLNAKAEDLRKADPKLTPEKAFTKACSENKSLYDEYRKEQRSARAA